MGVSSLIGSGKAAKKGLEEVTEIIAPPPPKAPKPPNAPAADPMLADAAAEMARRKARATEGRSSTILTGPGGVTGEAPGQRKTLLGA